MILGKEQVFSAVEAANDYVNHVEDAYVFRLFAWESEAQHRAEHCKCPQCVKEPKRAAQAIEQELHRLAHTDQDDYEP